MSRWSRRLVVAITVAFGLTGTANAELMTSTTYSVNESEVGGNGQFNGASTTYRIAPGGDNGGTSLGETFVGGTASTSYQTGAGFNTTEVPALTFVMTTSSLNLGTLSTSVATTGTGTFSVKNYTSYGYAVTVVGSAPTYAGHPLAGMGTQSQNSTGCTPTCASVPGSEQFGINLRANTSPVSVGADPVPIPSSAFSLSDPNVIIPLPYRTANQYRFFTGDTIVSAPASSGETDYTMAFLANISTATPGGKFTGNLQIVVTGTY